MVRDCDSSTFTVRTPRAVADRRHHGVDALLTDHDGQPITVRRVRSALLRLKDIISHEDDGQEAPPRTACSAGRQGTGYRHPAGLRCRRTVAPAEGLTIPQRRAPEGLPRVAAGEAAGRRAAAPGAAACPGGQGAQRGGGEGAAAAPGDRSGDKFFNVETGEIGIGEKVQKRSVLGSKACEILCDGGDGPRGALRALRAARGRMDRVGRLLFLSGPQKKAALWARARREEEERRRREEGERQRAERQREQKREQAERVFGEWKQEKRRQAAGTDMTPMCRVKVGGPSAAGGYTRCREAGQGRGREEGAGGQEGAEEAAGGGGLQQVARQAQGRGPRWVEGPFAGLVTLCVCMFAHAARNRSTRRFSIQYQTLAKTHMPVPQRGTPPQRPRVALERIVPHRPG